jgi:hypothetical protein
MTESSGPAEAPSDAELEAAIVSVVTAGAFDVAPVLAAQLEERRRARAGNVCLDWDASASPALMWTRGARKAGGA